MANAFLYNSPFEAQFDEDRAQLFVIQKLLRGVHTTNLVQVLAVRPTSGRVGFVDVQPLVLEQDTGGVVIAQAPIYNLPYMRLQGGSSAVILDPVVNDIGLAMYAERDITNIKTTLKAGAAPTDRTHSEADGLYIGGVLNPDPTQYVRFHPGATGIDIVTPGNLLLQASGNIDINVGGKVTMEATLCTFNTPVVFAKSVQGTATGAGQVSFAAPISAPDAIINGVTQSTHIHTDPQGGNTGTPHN